MKKLRWIVIMSLILALLIPGLLVNAATDPSMTFVFDLTVNGGTETEVGIWDEITLQVELRRVDEGRTGSYAMFSMQDEIIYDSRLFSLVANSQQMAPGYEFSVTMMEDGIRQRVIVSRVVVSPAGANTPDELVVAVFRLKTLVQMEEEPIVSRNFKVNTRSGDTYLSTSNDVSVTTRGFDLSQASVSFISFDDYNGLPRDTKLLKLTTPVLLEEACYLQDQILFYSPLYSDPAEGEYVYLLAVNDQLTEAEVLAGVRAVEGSNPVLSYNKDVNGDRRVDSTDAVLIYGLYKGLHLDDPDYTRVSMRMRLEADVNGDGVVDTQDAITVLGYIWDGRPGFEAP